MGLIICAIVIAALYAGGATLMYVIGGQELLKKPAAEAKKELWVVKFWACLWPLIVFVVWYEQLTQKEGAGVLGLQIPSDDWEKV